jgi:hypothetical protein
MEALKREIRAGTKENERTWAHPLKVIESLREQSEREEICESLFPIAQRMNGNNNKNNNTVVVVADREKENKKEDEEEMKTRTKKNEDPEDHEYEFSSKEVPFSTPRGKFDVYKMKEGSMVLISCNAKRERVTVEKENMNMLTVLKTGDSNETSYLVLVLNTKVKLPSAKTEMNAIVIQSRAQLSAAEKKMKVYKGKDVSEERMKQAFTVGEFDLSEDDTLKNACGLMRCFFKSSAGVKEYTKPYVKVKCVLKFSDGYLFLLKKHLMFLERPLVVTLVEELDQLQIERAEAGGSSNFDLACTLDGHNHEFLNISKEYLLQVREWLSMVCEAPNENDDDKNNDKKTKKETAQKMLDNLNSDDDNFEDDESDESFKGDDEDDDSDEEDEDESGEESASSSDEDPNKSNKVKDKDDEEMFKHTTTTTNDKKRDREEINIDSDSDSDNDFGIKEA